MRELPRHRPLRSSRAPNRRQAARAGAYCRSADLTSPRAGSFASLPRYWIACAEAARHWRPLAAIQLLAGLVLLVLQMARHSFLMMQRNFLDTVPFGLAGKLAAYLIEMPAACLHDTSLACDLMLGAITHSAPLVLGLSVVLGAVMLWTLIHRVGRLRRQTAGGPIANAVTPPK